MSELALQQANQYCKRAEKMLVKKDFVGFIENIGIASFLSDNGTQAYSRVNFLKIEGLYNFNQYTQLVEFAPSVLEKINEPDKYFLIRKYYAISLGYTGEFIKSKKVFKELLSNLSDNRYIWETYLNIAWVNLAFYKINEPNSSLDEAKIFLDKAKEHFEDFSNKLKRIYCNNLSVYYYYSGELEKGIEILEGAIKYCDEKDLPKIYNNLAEFCLKNDEMTDKKTLQIKEYTKLVEVIGTKYNDNFEMAKALYTNAMVELREGRYFLALDILYMSFEYFKGAEVFPYAFDCLKKINEIMKKLGEFIKNTAGVQVLSGQEMLSKVNSIRTKGLFYSNQHSNFVDSVSKRLNFEKDSVDLKIYEGIVYGYSGELDKALNTFKSIIQQTEDEMIKTMSYLNISWIYLGLEKTFDDVKLEEAKKYIDYANRNFNSLSNEVKNKILTNYSMYYYLTEEYKKSIEKLIDSSEYCDEKDLPDLYNNLAELYLTSNNDNSFLEIIIKYLEKAEVLGTKYNKTLSLGQTFNLKAEVELREDQFFTALDTLYLSFEYFKKSEATVSACECLLKINELMDKYRHNSLKSLRNNLKHRLANNS